MRNEVPRKALESHSDFSVVLRPELMHGGNYLGLFPALCCFIFVTERPHGLTVECVRLDPSCVRIHHAVRTRGVDRRRDYACGTLRGMGGTQSRRRRSLPPLRASGSGAALGRVRSDTADLQRHGRPSVCWSEFPGEVGAPSSSSSAAFTLALWTWVSSAWLRGFMVEPGRSQEPALESTGVLLVKCFAAR